jgi:hypothetical protein
VPTLTNLVDNNEGRLQDAFDSEKNQSTVSSVSSVRTVTPSITPITPTTAIVPLEKSGHALTEQLLTMAQKSIQGLEKEGPPNKPEGSIKDQSGEQLLTMPEDYQAYVARQKKVFDAIEKDIADIHIHAYHYSQIRLISDKSPLFSIVIIVKGIT